MNARNRRSADLPYYNDEPIRISPGGWLCVLLAIGVGFAQLTVLPFKDPPLSFIPAIIFTALPCLALMAVTGWAAPAVFRRLGLKDLLKALGFALLTIAGSFIVGAIVSTFASTASNPGIAALATMEPGELPLLLARIAIQLVGEELLTILPLLAVLWFCVQKLKLSRRAGLIAGIVVSTLLFAGMHLPTYNWNVLQCFTIIGAARLILTMAYLITRNIWVSSIAHIGNDWSLFLFSFVGGHLPIGADQTL